MNKDENNKLQSIPIRKKQTKEWKFDPKKGYMCRREDGKLVYQHRQIAEKVIGRKLKRHEVVHHINGDRIDNRNCNLLICTQPYHVWLHWKMSELYAKEHFGKQTVLTSSLQRGQHMNKVTNFIKTHKVWLSVAVGGLVSFLEPSIQAFVASHPQYVVAVSTLVGVLASFAKSPTQENK